MPLNWSFNFLDNLFHIWSRLGIWLQTSPYEGSKPAVYDHGDLLITPFRIWCFPDAHFTEKNTKTVHINLYVTISKQYTTWRYSICFQRGKIVVLFPSLPEGATRGINHITTSCRPINGLFLHWRRFLKGCKNTLRKNAPIVHLSFYFSTFYFFYY